MLTSFLAQIIVVIIIFWGMRKNDINGAPALLERNYSNAIRGICSIIVLFSHMSWEKAPVIGYLHFVAVSIFFFFSGYGVTCSCLKLSRGDFLIVSCRRIERYCAIYLSALLIKWILKIEYGSGGLFWFNVIILLNILYLLSCIVSERFKFHIIVLLGIMYSVVSQLMIQPRTSILGQWGASSLFFAVGIVFVCKEKYIVAFISNYAKIIIACSIAILFVSGYVYLGIRNEEFVDIKMYCFRVLISASSILLCYMLSIYVYIGNRTCCALGHMSAYTFAIQGITIGLIEKNIGYWSQGAVSLLEIVITLLISYLVCKIVLYLKKVHS